MATNTFDFNSATEGQSATTTTTGASSVFTTGGAVVHKAASGAEGAYGLELTSSATSPIGVEFDSTKFTSSRQENIRFCIKLPAVGSPFADATTLLQIYGGSTGSATIGRLKMMTGWLLRIENGIASNFGTVVTDMSAYAGTYVAFQVFIDTGTANNNGAVKVRVHTDVSAAAGTYLGTEFSATTWDLGSSAGTTYPVTRLRPGIITAQATARVASLDYVQIQDGGTGPALNGVPAAGSPTAVIAGGDKYPRQGETVALASTGSTTPGGGPTYAWSVTARPPGSPTATLDTPNLASCNVSNLVQGEYTVQLVVGQSGGLTATATAKLWVRPLAGVASRVKSVSGPYTNEGGAANAVTALDDGLDTTYLKSPSPVNGVPETLIFNPCDLGPITFTPRGYYLNTAVKRTIKFYKDAAGLTLLETQGPYNLVADTPTPNPFVPSSGTLSSLTTLADRKELRFDIVDELV